MLSITITDAYGMVSKLPKRIRLLDAIETPTVWAFKFSAGDDEVVGGVYDAVDKRTGGIRCIPIPYGMRELYDGTKLDIRQFQK